MTRVKPKRKVVPIARQMSIEKFEARARPNRRRGAPSKLDKALAKAARGGDADLHEYIRLLNSMNELEKRPVGRPQSLTPKYYRELLAVIEGQMARMRRSGGRVTAKAAITYLVHKWAAKQGIRKSATVQGIRDYQKKLSVARKKFPKLTDNSP